MKYYRVNTHHTPHVVHRSMVCVYLKEELLISTFETFTISNEPGLPDICSVAIDNKAPPTNNSTWNGVFNDLLLGNRSSDNENSIFVS